MADSSVVAASAAGAAVAGLFGVDAATLLYSFCGALVFILSTRETSNTVKVFYLPISTAVGYIFAEEVVALTPLHNTEVAAFLGGALIITSVLKVINIIRSLELSDLRRGR